TAADALRSRRRQGVDLDQYGFWKADFLTEKSLFFRLKNTCFLMAFLACFQGLKILFPRGSCRAFGPGAETFN
ncbi:hypothetical protein, partial [Pseudomonas tohonis]|uniref:hypothetical protein n=1 Tax=Pseudomonas tohonis TaxID=2725477 RepID=UPI001F449F7D